MATRLVKAFLICSGLGRIRRGYESFTRECFDSLRCTAEIDVRLFKGGGPNGAKERTLWNIPRNERIASCIGRLVGRDAYVIEQTTFFISLLPHLILERPAVIYFSDANLGNLLWHWRRFSKQKYHLLFSNGGPISPPFPRWDYIQQLSNAHFAHAVDAGEPVDKQFCVPYGFSIAREWKPLNSRERAATRERAGIPILGKVLLSVGAINSSHKRMDYLLRELAALPVPRPYLVILGQRDEQTQAIEKLAAQLLEPTRYNFRTVNHAEIEIYYKAADVFILPSLLEGFPRVFVEALAHGLPCLAHNRSVSMEVLGEFGQYADFTKSGSLTALLGATLGTETTDTDRLARHRYVYETFSWDRLRPKYVDMLCRSAGVERG